MHAVSFSLMYPRRPLFTTAEQICTVFRVGIFKAETSHIPGNEAPVYLGILFRR